MTATVIPFAEHPKVQARLKLAKEVDGAAMQLFGAKERADWLRRERAKNMPAAFDAMTVIRSLASLAED